jgi:hypothetical protein
VGSEGGWPANIAESGVLEGNLVLTVLDVSNPRSPRLLNSYQTALPVHTFWSSMTRWGPGRFAFASLAESGQPPRLLIIDLNGPGQPVIGQTDIPEELLGMNSMAKAGSLLYTASEAGLLIYSQPDPPVLSVAASVQAPRDSGASVVPGSFGTPPTTIAPGDGFDTLTWNFNLTAGASRTFDWRTAVSGLRPGEARQTALGGAVDFSLQGTPGQVALEPTVVAGEPILGLSPARQAVQPGQTARYSLTLRNPAPAPVTYRLDIQGLDPAWVALAPEASLEGSAETILDLAVAVPPFAPESTLGLTVTATGAGAQGSGVAELKVQGEPVAATGATTGSTGWPATTACPGRAAATSCAAGKATTLWRAGRATTGWPGAAAPMSTTWPCRAAAATRSAASAARTSWCSATPTTTPTSIKRT